jgi:DNA polymerase-3 subunit beta
MQTIKRVSLFSQENANNIKISVGDGRMKIKAEADQVGNEVAEIPAEIEGAAKEIAFNAQYLLEGLAVIEADEILFDVSSETSPGVFHAPEKDDYIYIVMPLKL